MKNSGSLVDTWRDGSEEVWKGDIIWEKEEMCKGGGKGNESGKD